MDEPDADPVNAALEHYRRERGIKWTEVARRAGVTPSTLWRYRTKGQRSDDLTRQLEIALHMPRDYLAALVRGEVPPEAGAESRRGRAGQAGRDELREMRDEVDELQRMAVNLERLTAEMITRLDAYIQSNSDTAE